MSAQRETLVPRAPSNRSFYNKMKEWGWKDVKNNGDWVTMRHPLYADKISVRQPTQHDANPSSVFIDVYRLTCDGNAEKFWGGPSSTYLHTLERRTERKKQEAMPVGAKVELARPEPRLVAATVARFDPPTPPRKDPMPNPTGTTNNKFGPPRDGNVTRAEVLAVMETNPSQMWTRPLILDRLVADGRKVEDRQKDLTDIANRIDRMIRQGLVTRPNRGEYWLTAHMPDKVRVEAVVNGVHKAHTNGVVAAVPAPTIVPEPVFVDVPVPDMRQFAAPVENVDDTIEAVLDLLLPNGFKASHLRFIAPWVEATKRMVAEVTG